MKSGFFFALMSLHFTAFATSNDLNLDPIILSNKIKDFVEKSLKRSKIQEHLDSLNFEKKVFDGKALLNKLIKTLGDKFRDRIKIVRRLQEVVTKSYSKNPANHPECCLIDDVIYDKRFRRKVSDDRICIVKAGKKLPSLKQLSSSFKEVCMQNLKEYPSLKWQYFASEAGLLTIYPATRYASCEAEYRLRPWYVQSNVPNPKHVVIVIDKSISMVNLHNGVKLIDLAIEATKFIIATLNPLDKFALLTFSNIPEPILTLSNKEDCFSTMMAQATPQNKQEISGYLDSIQPEGGSYYGDGLESAFDYLENEYISNADTSVDRVIMFLSDGEPDDPERSILLKLDIRNRKMNDSVVVMTYGLGDNDFSILKQMSAQNPDKTKTGIFTPLNHSSSLRDQMASFYMYFATGRKPASINEPIWTIPYLDKLGTGVMMTASLPVFVENNLVGVVAIDMTLMELLAESTYFNPNQLSYSFVMDDSGLLINHPFFPYKNTHDSLFVPATAFESDYDFLSVFESIKRGENGNKTFVSTRVISQGDSNKYGVKKIRILSEYFWGKIPNTPFSVCVVNALNGTPSLVAPTGHLPKSSAQYHRFDLVPPKRPCLHLGNLGSADEVVAFLSAGSFNDPEYHLSMKLTARHVASVTSFLEGSTAKHHNVKETTRNDLAALHVVKDLWINQDEEKALLKEVVRRYVATTDGAFLSYPTGQVPDGLDPTARAWFAIAIANQNKNSLTAPYKDASIPASVITISRPLFAGRDSELQKEGNQVFAVLGIDLMFLHFYNIFLNMYPQCKTSAIDCNLLDKAGFFIFNKRYRNLKSDDILHLHLTEYAPEIASILIQDGVLRRTNCSNIESGLLQRTYWISDLESVYHGTFRNSSNGCVQFQLISVPETNAFILAQKHGDETCDNSTRVTHVCSCFMEALSGVYAVTCKTSWNIDDHCECPCSDVNPFYRPCQNEYEYSRFFGNSSPPCGVYQPDMQRTLALDIDTTYLPVCYHLAFTIKENASTYFHLLHIFWVFSVFAVVYLVISERQKYLFERKEQARQNYWKKQILTSEEKEKEDYETAQSIAEKDNEETLAIYAMRNIKKSANHIYAESEFISSC